ncbi:MAG TPA: hypothetical protein VG097_19665 [Gemmata sp.]|jgi:uncharacterized protein (DUF39 family)|nr:hypothetical protein [Gemmata sp.]
MTIENFDNTLRVLLTRRPYQMFTVELHGGERFEVDYPNALVFRDGMAVFVAPGGIPHLFDHDSVNQFIAAGTSSISEPPDAA